MVWHRARIEASGERSAAVGANFGVTNTGDYAQFFIGGYEPLADSYLSPAMLFRELDLDSFVGREWLRAELDHFVCTRNCGYVIIEADAGLGKTTFLANLTITRGWAHHFVSIPRGNEPALALKSLAAQLISEWGLAEQSDWAPGGALPMAAERPDWFYRLLEYIATRRDEERPGEPIVIIIDGIDEVSADHGTPFGLPRLPPSGVFFVVSKRTGSPPLQVLDPRTTLTLTADDPRNLIDMQIRLEAISQEKEIADHLIAAGWSVDDFVHALGTKCAGVWVYLHYIIRELQLGLRAPTDLASLPGDLWAYYAQILVSGKGHDLTDWDERLTLLATLGACAEPVEQSLLCRLAGVTDSSQLYSLLRHEWRPLLRIYPFGDDPRSTRFSTYHASLDQFLHGELESVRLTQLTAERPLLEQLQQATVAAHARIANYYLAVWGGLDRGLTELRNQAALAHTDDDYGRRHCISHLVRAGLHEELHALLALDWPEDTEVERSRRINAWYWVHDRCSDLPGYLRDLRAARRLAEMATAEDSMRGLPALNFAREIHYYLMEASILSITSTIPPALLGRLVDSGLWAADRAVDYAREVNDPHMKYKALARVAQAIESDDVSSRIRKEALEAAQSIDDYGFRVSALAALASHLTESQLAVAIEEAIHAIRAIGDDLYRCWAIAEIAPHMTEGQLNAILAETLDTGPLPGGEWGWSTLMRELSPLLSDALLAKAIDIVQSLSDENEQAVTLTILAPYLSRPLLGEALNAARALNNEQCQTKAIVGLASHLDNDLLDKALSITESIRDDLSWAEARAGLAPHLPEPIRTKMVNETMRWLDVMEDHQLGEVLAGLVPHLPERWLGKALNLTSTIQQNRRGNVLAVLVPRLPDSMLSEALMVAQTVDENWVSDVLAQLTARLPEPLLSELLIWVEQEVGRTIDAYADEVLITLAPYLSELQVGKLFEIANSIGNEWTRMRTFVGLSPYLPEPDRTAAARHALRVAEALDEGWDGEALAELGPRLPESLLSEALGVAQSIEVQFWRMEAVDALAPLLPDRLLGTTLRVLQSIGDRWWQASALVALAPYIEEENRTSVVAEVLQGAQAVSGEEGRGQALVALAPYLDELQLREAWNAVQAITDDWVREDAIAEVAPI